jgi:hypothetical protein
MKRLLAVLVAVAMGVVAALVWPSEPRRVHPAADDEQAAAPSLRAARAPAPPADPSSPRGAASAPIVDDPAAPGYDAVRLLRLTDTTAQDIFDRELRITGCADRREDFLVDTIRAELASIPDATVSVECRTASCSVEIAAPPGTYRDHPHLQMLPWADVVGLRTHADGEGPEQTTLLLLFGPDRLAHPDFEEWFARTRRLKGLGPEDR